MRRSIIVAALIAALLSSLPVFAAKTHVGAPADFPTVNGFPALFGTVASGTGTSTVYLEAIPVAVNATTGAVLVDLSSGTVSLNASGAIGVIPAVWTTYTCSAVTVTSTSSNVASMASRVFCAIQNLDTATSIWINPGALTAATGTGNLEILPGEVWSDYVAASINVPMYASPSVSATVIQGK